MIACILIQAGFYDIPGDARGFSVAGNYAYLADSRYGLVILGFLPYQVSQPLVLRNYQQP